MGLDPVADSILARPSAGRLVVVDIVVVVDEEAVELLGMVVGVGGRCLVAVVGVGNFESLGNKLVRPWLRSMWIEGYTGYAKRKLWGRVVPYLCD